MLKVLLAEDEGIELKFLQNYLTEHYSDALEIVASCKDGKEALEEGLRTAPDVAFLDIQMPFLSGLEVSKKLKEAFPEIAIVILTAYGVFDYAQKAISIGVSSYLVKPFSNQELDDSISEILEEKRVKTKVEIKEMISRLSDEIASQHSVSHVGKKTYEYMAKHYAEPLSLDSVSEAIGFSSSYVSKCLAKDYGKSFKVILLELRCVEASKLLAIGKMNVSEVAVAVGIPDSNYFIKCFKEQFGETPKKYSVMMQKV